MRTYSRILTSIINIPVNLKDCRKQLPGLTVYQENEMFCVNHTESVPCGDNSLMTIVAKSFIKIKWFFLQFYFLHRHNDLLIEPLKEDQGNHERRTFRDRECPPHIGDIAGL